MIREELTEILEQALRENRTQAELDVLAGIKYFRLPVLYATPASGTVVLGQSWAGQSYTGQIIAPSQSYAWSILRLTAGGLGTGTAPDVLNIYRNGTQGNLIWQLNGNNLGYTFGPMEMVLLPGEQLVAASSGSLVSTAQITLTGDAVEIPQMMIGKLVL